MANSINQCYDLSKDLILSGMKITSSHPIFSLENKIQEICAPFFSLYGFNYFQYCRLYKDGHVSFLFNDTRLFTHMLDLDYPSFSSFTEKHKSKQSYWFLWDEELPWLPVKMAREAHNLNHGITLLRRHEHYYDMIGVTLDHSLSDSKSFYLQNIVNIHEFITTFEIQHTSLLQTSFHHKILMPKHQQDTNLPRILSDKKTLFIPHLNTHITHQELSCVQLLLKGLSYKEIARILNISPRSVETYLMRVKDRSHCRNTQELHHLLTLCPGK